MYFAQRLLDSLNTDCSPSHCLKRHQMENLRKRLPVATLCSQPTGERLAPSPKPLKPHTPNRQWNHVAFLIASLNYCDKPHISTNPTHSILIPAIGCSHAYNLLTSVIEIQLFEAVAKSRGLVYMVRSKLRKLKAIKKRKGSIQTLL